MITDLLLKMGFLSKNVSHTSPLLSYLSKSKPFILSPQKSWHDHLTDTCEQSVYNFKVLQKQALSNINAWKKQPQKLTNIPAVVEVSDKDSFTAAAKITQDHGVIPSVLIFASAYYPAGYALPEMAYHDGLAAQEEVSFNMTTLSYGIDKQLKLAKDEAYLYYDRERRDLVYHPSMTENIKAMTQMSRKDRKKLSMLYTCKAGTPLYTVPITDLNNPHVCFKSPLCLVESDYLNNIGRSSKQAIADLSYQTLPNEKIFPFYAMFSAAVEPQDVAGSIFDWNDSTFRQAYTTEMRRRICAQLDTLILHGHRHAVLGAFGCGAFGGKAEIVAAVYMEEIQSRSHCFDSLVFAIANQGELNNNYQIFREHLHGLSLAHDRIIDASIKLRL